MVGHAPGPAVTPIREDCGTDDKEVQTIDVINAATGSTITTLRTHVPVDIAVNSTFTLAVLFIVAKKLDCPRAWLAVLHPQKSAQQASLRVLRQIPSEETMHSLLSADGTCVACGDPGDQDLSDADACVACLPACLCQACHVQVGKKKYCLDCIPAEIQERLNASQKRRLSALTAYRESLESNQPVRHPKRVSTRSSCIQNSCDPVGRHQHNV